MDGSTLTSPDTNSDIVYTPPSQDGYPSNAAATAAAALSRQSTAGSDATITNIRKRKPAAAPGSRGVANLTPEQLQKKRQNDREAQRAIRERTKNTIEGLQQRIKQLESQQPYQDLQRVEQERDRALAECERLRNKLAVVQSVISGTQLPTPSLNQQQAPAPPNLHGMSDLLEQFVHPVWLTQGDETTELATLTAQQSPLPPLSVTSTPQYAPHVNETIGYEPQPPQSHLHPELQSPSSGAFGTSTTLPATPTPSYPLDPSSTVHYASSTGISYEHRMPAPSVRLDHGGGERLGLNYVLEPKQPCSSTSSPSAASQHYSPTTALDKALPLHSRLTRIKQMPSAGNPLDNILNQFVQDRRDLIAKSVPLRDVIGPDEPTYDGLRDPSAPLRDDAHPISALLTKILATFPGISGLADKIAVHYLMFSIIRWQICPCEHCYDRMPPYLRPIKAQLEVPHSAWMDHLQWPFMRHQLIMGPELTLNEFFEPFTREISVNWPYDDEQTLLPAEQPGGPQKLNPVFFSHFWNVNNWSLGSVFQDAFPRLVNETVRITKSDIPM